MPVVYPLRVPLLVPAITNRVCELLRRCLCYRLKPQRNMLALAKCVRAAFVRSLHSFSRKMKQDCDTVFGAESKRAKWPIAYNFGTWPSLFSCQYPHTVHIHSPAMCRGWFCRWFWPCA
jgi:hypothetical protein